ncbi:MAG TPA: SMC-Scp complex subunit ScpB [Smithella sp.]|nr:SMC-Scp complex subunit ScpB [Smithella sp.]
MEKIKAIVEALIFASESPLAPEKIRAVFPDMEKKEIQQIIQQLVTEYHERQGGIQIQEVAGGFQFRTNPELGSWVKKLKSQKPQSLSPASLETLAIIAYKQPIVKSEIESIRGVDVGGPLKNLLEKKLIRIMGRKDVPGKPIIYGTTKKFLEVFNLRDLMDLPNLRELKELQQQQEMALESSESTDDDAQEDYLGDPDLSGDAQNLTAARCEGDERKSEQAEEGGAADPSEDAPEDENTADL